MPATRTQWAAGRHLQQAADCVREAFPDSAVADRLDQAANEMAWLAPFREHEGGYRPWRVATRLAHRLLALPDPDTCTTCHTHEWQPLATTEA